LASATSGESSAAATVARSRRARAVRNMAHILRHSALAGDLDGTVTGLWRGAAAVGCVHD
jgi:hypothetical protein